MVHECAVVDCPNKSDIIIHYTLPEEPTRRQKWVEFLEKGRKTYLSINNTRICGSHFTEDSFTKLDLGFTKRLILNVNAVPSIYPDGLATQPQQDETPPAENGSEAQSGIIVTDTISLACVKEEPLDDDEFSCDAMRIIKVEPLDEGYGDSSSHHPTDDEMFDIEGTNLKIEDYVEPITVDDGKPFHCTHCGEGFFNNGVLKQHELKHKTLKPPDPMTNKCKHCGKVFAHRAFLKAHMKIHADLKAQMLFSCSKCTRRFRNQSSLNKHMQHHLTRLKYPCPVCGEDFELKGSLHFHIKKHPGERFRCRYCDQRFLKIDAYMRHVDRHTVVTPYYCEICKIYQLTERGFALHQKRHARKDMEQTMADNSGINEGKPSPINVKNSTPQLNDAEENEALNSPPLDSNSPVYSPEKTETESESAVGSECPA